MNRAELGLMQATGPPCARLSGTALQSTDIMEAQMDLALIICTGMAVAALMTLDVMADAEIRRINQQHDAMLTAAYTRLFAPLGGRP